jgi:hypothetical protein
LQVSFCGRRRRHVASTTLLTNAASFFVFSAWLLPANPFSQSHGGKKLLFRTLCSRRHFSFPTEDATGVLFTLPIAVIDFLPSSALDIFLESDVDFVQEDQFFGHNGEHTEELMKQHATLAKFWKTGDTGPPILLAGLHSETLQGNLAEPIAYFLEENYEGYMATAQHIETATALVQQAIETEIPKAFANPRLTFEAFYYPQAEIPGADPLSAGILLGDGIPDFTDSLGLGEAGPDYIHAHEFGHAIQFIMDLENVSGDIASEAGIFQWWSQSRCNSGIFLLIPGIT